MSLRTYSAGCVMEEVFQFTRVDSLDTVLRGDKKSGRCAKEMISRAKTKVVCVLRRSLCGALQPELWAAFGSKARRTKIERRKLLSLATLRSL